MWAKPRQATTAEPQRLDGAAEDDGGIRGSRRIKDASALFPQQINRLCGGWKGAISPLVTMGQNTTYSENPSITDKREYNAKFHDFRHGSNDSRPDWYLEQMTYLRANYKKGVVALSSSYVKKLANSENKAIAILNDNVFDMSE